MHDHAHGVSGVRGQANHRLLAISLTLTATVMVVQIVGAVLTGSLALLADAAHMFADASALVIALIASLVARRPADERNTYGYQRAEVFGALINAVLLIVLCLWIASEAVGRLLRPAEVEVAGGLMIVVAVVGLVANAISMWLLSAAQRTSINVRGAYLEVLGDLIGSAVVIVAAVVIVTTGWMPADALASLLIAVMIVPRAISLLREVVAVLGERAPDGTNVTVIREHILSADGVADVHDIHVWQLTRGAPVFTAHVVVDPDVLTSGRSARLLSSLQGCLADHFDVEHSTFQFEPAGHREHDAH
ncbi:cation diffusion facilitator family transporter [Microbacterium dextranolyticum]|uniref:Cation transporter n=1 Tax=Microbacterium dextranolyticum TaxID=36806 RepID=A0A9W6M5R0_9MICO|nr:cation diffusion facilitator family transporter [Microbacterium dextranolyticum]MBM7463240.1 cobalt-zinc-cadmium efflux system protein [Microbacterium dextranolyticum]GLJ95654.1 cation transporter [Microbacterium dextranolyticum]